MGTWGYNNFESDYARDVLCIWINRIVDRIREVFTFDSQESLYGRDGESDIVANVDILGTLIDKYLYYDLEVDEVRKWKREYLSTFDRLLAKVNNPEAIAFEKKRREVVEQTFDRLLQILEKIAADVEEDMEP